MLINPTLSPDANKGIVVLKVRLQMKVRDIIRLIEGDGWYWVKTKGSHKQYKHTV